MKASRDAVKTLIKISTSVEEADKIIEENYDFKTFGEKIAFLQGMFGVKVVDVHDTPVTEKEDSDRMTYFSLLQTIFITEGF